MKCRICRNRIWPWQRATYVSSFWDCVKRGGGSYAYHTRHSREAVMEQRIASLENGYRNSGVGLGR